MVNVSFSKHIVSFKSNGFFCSMLAVCLGFSACLIKKLPKTLTFPGNSIEQYGFSVSGVGEKDLRADGGNFRIFVGRKDRQPMRPRLLVRVRGLVPGRKVYWQYEFFPGPLNNMAIRPKNVFSAAAGFVFNAAGIYSLADEHGEAAVKFSGTTYAGDRFRLGWGLKPVYKQASGHHGAKGDSIDLSVWKRLYLEPVKVVKNVRFPMAVWDLVRRHLSQVNIELVIESGVEEIDPRRSDLTDFFYTGGDDSSREQGVEPRYGPLLHPWQEQGEVMKNMAKLISDGKRETITVVVLGAFSKRHDLIADANVEPPPQPVAYTHRYSRRELDLGELSSSGMGSSIGGDCPAIFIWSDFWWLVSQVLEVGHEEALACVILHELGHQLLNALPAPASAILDEGGHIYEQLSLGKSIMGGFGPLFTAEQRSEEKKFIKHPVWHEAVEILIRGGYLPLQQ